MIVTQKRELREKMKEKRATLFATSPQVGEEIASLFFTFFDFSSHTSIGAYWPMGTELDTRPLLHRLYEKGLTCALPCVTSEGLLFRLWKPSLKLCKGKFGILEPPATSPLITPDVLLVPLLAFDKNGHRLGYGQGHYDHYLHHHKALTIGIGFKEQEIEEVPHQPHDYPLDYILTEGGVQAIKKSAGSDLDFQS